MNFVINVFPPLYTHIFILKYQNIYFYFIKKKKVKN